MKLAPGQIEELLSVLKIRFEKNMNRHKGITWDKLFIKLDAQPAKLWSLNEMESTGGEPDVVDFDQKAEKYIFMIVHRYGH